MSKLPPNLTHLFFGNGFNQDVSKLPHFLTHLIFNDCFTQCKILSTIEQQSKAFRLQFDQDISKLPHFLTYLTFGWKFNKDPSNLPSNITHLTFGHCFNQNVSKLHQNLLHLTFGCMFNHDVSKLPHFLTLINFGWSFNQDVSKLPQTITHLTLGLKFNQKFNIPSNIKYLKLNCNNQYLINSLPTSIKKLIIDADSKYNADLNCLPNFIEELHLNRHYEKRILCIPQNLKKIRCYKSYQYIDDFAKCLVETYDQ